MLLGCRQVESSQEMWHGGWLHVCADWWWCSKRLMRGLELWSKHGINLADSPAQWPTYKNGLTSIVWDNHPPAIEIRKLCRKTETCIRINIHNTVLKYQLITRLTRKKSWELEEKKLYLKEGLSWSYCICIQRGKEEFHLFEGSLLPQHETLELKTFWIYSNWSLSAEMFHHSSFKPKLRFQQIHSTLVDEFEK